MTKTNIINTVQLEGLNTREFNEQVEHHITEVESVGFLQEFVLELANEMHTDILGDIEEVYELTEDEYLALDDVERANLFTDPSGDFYETIYHEMLKEYVEAQTK